MRPLYLMAFILAAAAVLTGFALMDSSDSYADTDYVVYYIIEDDRLPAETYSINCEGVFVTNTYVFFKSVTGDNYTTVGKLPATENIVSRYVDSDLEDDGFVLNPEGGDASGWFRESSFTNRVSQRDTLYSMDSDHDGIIYLYMKAAKWYHVRYEARTFSSGAVENHLWYDGYYMEMNHTTLDSRYNENRFEDVEYTIRLVEGASVSGLADSGVMFSTDDAIPAYLALSLQAAPRDTDFYDLDTYTVDARSVTWFLRENTYYPEIDPANCTPVYSGLTVTDSLDTDHDGTIVLYATSTKTEDSMSFFAYLSFAREDLNERNWGDTGYDGTTETIVVKLPAKRQPPNVVQQGSYTMALPVFDGFTFDPNASGSWDLYVTGAGDNMDATVTFSNGNVTISGCQIHQSATSGSLGIYFKYVRDRITVTVTAEDGPQSVTGRYGCDMPLPSTFSSHQLYRWDVTGGLTGSVWASAGTYYYTVNLDDLDAASPAITAVWQEGLVDTVYTVEYVSRVVEVPVVLTPDVVTNDGSVSLPMISYEGYAHLGWALIDPDSIIDYDTTSLVIYPGRTSLVPSAVSSQYKTVPDPNNPNLITIRLYAVWCTTYTITFNANGGTGTMDDIGPVQVTDYVSLTPNAFTRNNYNFAGWALSPNGNVAYANMASVIGLSTQTHGLVTLYAVWTTDTYFVVFDGSNATSGTMTAQSVNVGDPVTLELNEYARTGYTFSGWATSSGGSVAYADGATFTPESSVSLYAVWTPITYYVEFNANGGTGSMSRMTFLYDQTQPLTANAFTNGGLSFGGWSASDGNTYSNGYMVKNLTSVDGATVTMYAIWSQYYVEYNANNGSGNADTVTVASGVPYIIIENSFSPGNEGEIFVTWNTSADGSGISYAPGSEQTDLAAAGQTIRLYAIWNTYVYHIAFDANGGSGSMATLDVQGGQSVVLTNGFTYTDHYFLGWSKNPLATVATYSDGETVVDIGTGVSGETVTLYAIWSEQMVTVTVTQLKYVDGGAVVTLDDVGGRYAFGLDHDILAGDLIRLTLGTTYSSYDRYEFEGSFYYLANWTYTIGGNDYSVAYGTALLIPEDVNSITITAHYTEYWGYFRYNINNGTAADPLVTKIGLERGVNDTYTATANLSDCPFVYEGYEFCMWSRSANSISDPMKAGSAYQYISEESEQYYDFYAVWIKVEPTGTNYYSGEEIVPEYAVTAKYGTTVSSLVPTTVSLRDNVNAGNASITVTLNVTYLGTSVTEVFVISPALVTVDVDDDSKDYGEADPTFTGTVTCNTSAPTGVLAVAYERSNADEGAGTYADVLTATYTPNANYSVTIVPGTFTIGPADVTITVNDSSKAYGTQDPAFTGTVVCSTGASTAALAVSYYRTNAGVEAEGVYVDVLSAHYTPSGNFTVTIIPGTFTIIVAAQETAYYIIVDGRGGGQTYTDSETVIVGQSFADKTVQPNAGYSFYEWIRVVYDGDTIVSSNHITYGRTLESDHISAGTYMALFAVGDSITFNANSNEATGSMAAQGFSDRTGTLSPNAFVRPGYVFMGWSKTSDGPVAYYDQTPMTLVSGLSTDDASNVLYAVWAQYTYTSDITWTMDGYIFSSNGSFLRTDPQASYAIITGENTAVISASWLQILSGQQGMKLYVEMTYGNIMFDSSCLATFAAAGEDVTFSIKPVNSAGRETFDITNGGEIVVMYNITASYYDSGVKTYIHALGGTATVTVRNMSGGSSVAYVGDDGSQPVTVSSTADTITFTTDHFSLYEITEETASEQPEGESASLLIVMAVIASVLTAATFLLRSGRH